MIRSVFMNNKKETKSNWFIFCCYLTLIFVLNLKNMNNATVSNVSVIIITIIATLLSLWLIVILLLKRICPLVETIVK